MLAELGFVKTALSKELMEAALKQAILKREAARLKFRKRLVQGNTYKTRLAEINVNKYERQRRNFRLGVIGADIPQGATRHTAPTRKGEARVQGGFEKPDPPGMGQLGRKVPQIDTRDLIEVKPKRSLLSRIKDKFK